MLKIRIAIFAIISAFAIASQSDCDGMTQTDCQRAELIAAGAID